MAKKTEIVALKVSDIVVSPYNDRTRPKQADPGIIELGKTMLNRQLQPVLVRKHPKKKGKFELIFGERRLIACKAVKKPEINATIAVMTTQEAIEAIVTENLHREDLSPFEESKAVKRLVEAGWDQKTIADHMGKTVKWVLRRANLSNLSEAWQKAVNNPESEVFGMSACQLEIIALVDKEAQDELLESNTWFKDLSVKELERIISEHTRKLGKAMWDLEDKTLSPAGACTACKKRSSFQPGLFEETAKAKDLKKDTCLSLPCWKKKGYLSIIQKETELKKDYPDIKLVNPEKHYVSAEEEELGINPFPLGVELSTAKDKKAQPVMFTEGPKMGKLGWIKKTEQERSNSRPKDKKGNPMPTPLKDRKARLNKRRNTWVIEQIRLALKDGEASKQKLKQPKHDELVCMALAFGIKGEGSSGWNIFPKFLKKKNTEQNKALWQQVRKSLEESLKFYQDPCVKEAKLACKYCGLDFDAFFMKAVDKIPDPKIWATLNLDGTPKKKSA